MTERSVWVMNWLFYGVMLCLVLVNVAYDLASFARVSPLSIGFLAVLACAGLYAAITKKPMISTTGWRLRLGLTLCLLAFWLVLVLTVVLKVW